MKYEVDYDDLPFHWGIGNRPCISGSLYRNGIPFVPLGTTFRFNNLGDVQLNESPAVVDQINAGRFEFFFPTVFSRTSSGNVIQEVLPNAGVSGALIRKPSLQYDDPLTGDPILTSDNQLDIQIPPIVSQLYSGQIPDVGWCLIGSEWCKYSFALVEDAANLGNFFNRVTLEERGIFQTGIQEHLESTPIYFSKVKEILNIQPRYRIQNFD